MPGILRTLQDMTALSFLHEPGVLWNLQSRYKRGDIYTYTGSILIAVNPFRPVPHLYGANVIDQYRSSPREQLPPHVYATACAAFRNMIRDGAGQAILVTGESGAGKTETAKLIMACLTHLGAQHSSSRHSGAGAILESNPLLEAFGNAKTLRNNNSSRFGKYVEIFFDPAAGGMVTGAAVRTYLLERSRVVAVNNPERSFHIFYQLVYGASPGDRAAWRLPESASDFAYLARSSCFTLPGQCNVEEYHHTRRAMSHIGLSEQQQSAVLATVAAVLHLGNITFTDSDGEGAVVAGAPGRRALEAAAELLGVEPEPLAEALTTRQIQTPEGPIATPLSVQAAVDARDSMAKVVYARLFEWLVSAINTAVDEAHNGTGAGGGSSGGTPPGRHLSIGLLDIYGFESFDVNDLEQLCINLTNEKLQQHFNQHVFKWEQAEYEREGVDWSYISFRDNAEVLDLLEGRMGLMDLLDELCRFPKASAEDLSHKYRSSAAVSANPRFTKLNRPATAFGVEHYAGSVTYSTQNFLEKNRDYVVAEHQSLLGRSRRPLLQELFAPEVPAAQFQFRSVSSQCRRQLAELMSALSQLQPHYVRCIKPNPSGAPGEFNAPYSLHQLRCGGVMEAVRIACAGYSYRRPFAAFLEHFWQLCPEPVHAQEDTPRVGEVDAGPQYHLGHTKVFLRATAAAALERRRLAATNAAATTIQAHLRRHQEFRQERAALIMQTTWRSAVIRREYLFTLRYWRAAVRIQTAWRGYAARQLYLQARKGNV
ncbi:type XI myosin heavy chain MyoB [Volvox carteri f. nagariensis]|uniref:Type XI myosin heavy chain MyoB n=1 Tax=Volvox carteri f. nagariensis TaxID=3068 RepID=D8TMB6_VOLCA|nr:type XI myosin heavy chain MyoB [Volvox carteri f. nagariensis]EFJ51474.1 type XI myosin heavy chain MyoB [Volvox carteri f. nagariensis]|eukprot:XP_002947426.1 type XI myosin heavy chain MyoB [Volvox carteri f. nagariensis]